MNRSAPNGAHTPTAITPLEIRPLAFRDACDLADALHRHHARPAGHKFSIGAADHGGRLVCGAIVGRPIARHLDDAMALEVARLVTDGSRNCCSMLLADSWRAAKALGYRRLITHPRRRRRREPARRRVDQGARPAAALGWSTLTRPRKDRGTDEVARILWEAPPAPGSDTPARRQQCR